jgi:hypothetical protein
VTAGPSKNEVGGQGPLPETSWFWRRVFSYGFAVASLALVGWAMITLRDLNQPDLLYSLARYLLGVHVLVVTYYMVAPSAEQVVRTIKTASILKHGINVNFERGETAASAAQTDENQPSELPPPPAPCR